PDIPALPNTPVTAAIPAPPGSRHADPTKTFAGGCIGTPTTGTGPLQPITSYNAQPAAREVMEFFGVTGTPTVSYVGTTPDFGATNGDQEQQIQVTFTASGSNATIAWGGHIASRLDWGCTDQQLSAGGIHGSPYHMRLKDLEVNGKDFN